VSNRRDANIQFVSTVGQYLGLDWKSKNGAAASAGTMIIETFEYHWKSIVVIVTMGALKTLFRAVKRSAIGAPVRWISSGLPAGHITTRSTITLSVVFHLVS
jgi:hypothetical protein